MKQLLSTIVICLCALGLVDPSRAADPTVYLEWTYDNPPADLAGYHLYVNDARVHDLNAPGATTWSGPVTLLDGNNTVELTAYDAGGQEGARSDPYTVAYDAPPGGAPVIMTVTIQ
jgi:hypothetical protein